MSKKLYETLLGLSRDNSLVQYARHVIEWNDVARKARGGEATPFELQWTFVEEEFKETIDALKAGDRVEAVDGACDMFVVASYALYLHCPEILKEKCHFNDNVISSLDHLATAIADKRPVETLEQVVALLYRLDINLGYNLQEVLDSNDSKYPTISQLLDAYSDTVFTDEKDLLEKECLAIAERSEGRYSDITFVKEGEQYVFLDGKGKIMKPSTFRKPKIIV